MNGRIWRKEPVKSANGFSWRLITGRGADRIRFGLGMITEGQAQRALETMQREEDRTVGTPRHGEIFRLAEQDREKAVAFLIAGSAEAEEVFGPLPVDHGGSPLEDYVRDVYEPHRREKRPASWDSEQHFWKPINAALGRLRLRELASADGAVRIDEYLSSIKRKDGRPASTATKRLHRAAIRACLTHARRKNHIQAMPEFFTIEHDPENPGRGETDTLTLDERKALIEQEPDQKLRTLWTIASHLGCRPAENCRASWEDVLWDERGKGYHGALVVRGTKTEASAAKIPLIGPCRAALLEWWVACGQPTTGIIFPAGRDGEPYVSNTTYSAALRTACKRAKIAKKITPYSLRHTTATLATAAGMRSASVAKLLRHTNPRMVEQRYDHTGALDVPDLDLLAEG